MQANLSKLINFYSPWVKVQSLKSFYNPYIQNLLLIAMLHSLLAKEKFGSKKSQNIMTTIVSILQKWMNISMILKNLLDTSSLQGLCFWKTTQLKKSHYLLMKISKTKSFLENKKNTDKHKQLGKLIKKILTSSLYKRRRWCCAKKLLCKIMHNLGDNFFARLLDFYFSATFNVCSIVQQNVSVQLKTKKTIEWRMNERSVEFYVFISYVGFHICTA